MITVDKEQGIAADHGQIWKDEADEPLRVIVDISLCDAEEISFFWREGKHTVNLYLPVDRIQRLLETDVKD